MKLGRRGQYGPVGEDFVYFTVLMIVVSFFLFIVVSAFVDHEVRYEVIDSYRLALVYADKAAATLGVHPDGDVSAGLARVLDIEEAKKKLAGGSCGDICSDCMICVRDRRDAAKSFCCQSASSNNNPDPDYLKAAIRLPVALKVNYKEYHPGMIEVTLIR